MHINPFKLDAHPEEHAAFFTMLKELADRPGFNVNSEGKLVFDNREALSAHK